MRAFRKNACPRRSSRCKPFMTLVNEKLNLPSPQSQQGPCTKQTSSPSLSSLHSSSTFPPFTLMSSYSSPSRLLPSRSFSFSTSYRCRITPLSSSSVLGASHTLHLPSSRTTSSFSGSSTCPRGHHSQPPFEHRAFDCSYENISLSPRLSLSCVSSLSSSRRQVKTKAWAPHASFSPNHSYSSMNPARVISSFSPSSLSSSSLSYGLSSDFSSSSLRCLSLFSVYFSYSFPCRSVTTHSSALGRPFHTLRLIVSESSFRCRSSSPFPCVKDHAFLDNAVSRESGAGRSYVHTASRQQTKDTSKPDAKKEKEEKDSSLFSSRYANLRKEDRDKLIAQKMMAGGKKRSEGNPIIPWEEFRSEDLDTPLREFQVHAREMETRKAKRLREQEREKPAFLRRRIFKAKRLTQGAEDDHDTEQHITAANFSEETHMLSLVEDLHKAELYCQTTDKLSRQWSTPGGVAKGILGDQFFDVMASALREDLQDQSRPVLVNELTDFENPYMMKREALKRILLHSCTRNCLDESLVDQFLDRRPELVKLRSEARLPPEAIEPLAAFVGVTRFSFDRRRRLEQKLEAVKQLLDHLPGQSEQQGKHDENTGTRPPLDDEAIEEVLRVLPENYPSDELHPAHPFRNHFGFESSVPVGVVGSISMGRGQKKLERELGQLRYPTLQRVAHSLPKDPKYRESVAHAIKILERSRGWDFESKIKAVNSLVEVWNNLAPGKTYERILEHAFPVFRGRGTVKKTRPRSVVFNKGLKYIRSLTTQKPLYVRLKGK